MAMSHTRTKVMAVLGLLLAVTLLATGSNFKGISQKMEYALEVFTPARQITIVADGQTMALAVRVDTVEEALAEAKVDLGENDRVSRDPDDKVVDQMEIVVTRVTKGEIVEHERIYFREIRRANHNLERGVTRTVRRGREGRRANHYVVIYEDGQRVARTLLRTEIIEPKVDRIVEYGTIGFLSRGGNTYRFNRMFYVTATAYTAGPESTGKFPDHPAFGITRSGLPVEVGHIAVDPVWIPLLSHVWLEGLCAFSVQFSGRYFATDTGSAIRGKRIDIYFERVEDALRFGRRRMRVYLLAR